MIHVYHGSQPYWPLLAGLRHLGYKEDIEPGSMVNKDWNWKVNPLLIAGQDGAGNIICCLVHGTYGGLYRRALDGVSAIFGLPVRCVDVDHLLFIHSRGNVLRCVFMQLARWMPRLFGQRFRQTVDEIVESQRLK